MIRRFLVSRARFGIIRAPHCISRPAGSILSTRWYSAGPQLNKEIITERILELLEDYGNVKHPEKISASASFSKDLGLDSLDTVELLMEVENEFSILIPDHEADELNTVSQTIDYISSQPDAC